jgi:hypothetical protein
MSPDAELVEDRLRSLAAQIAIFEATESVADTGPGRRRDGANFEKLMLTYWDMVGAIATSRGADADVISNGNRRWSRLTVGTRTLYLPSTQPARAAVDTRRWLRLDYPVRELVAAYPGEAEAVARYAPKHGPYAGSDYPLMFTGMNTEFDDAVLLEEGGVLREKILLEYKTAKASGGAKIDGNAHERLTFQMMQYLEIATRYPRCSMVVIANSAFERYRNKYHVSFHAQADRLSCFSWFTMKHICAAEQYLVFANGLLGWLATGEHRAAGGLP